MRKFGIKYSALHPSHDEVRAAFAKVACREDWETVLAAWYSEDLPGVHPDPAIHATQQSCDTFAVATA